MKKSLCTLTGLAGMAILCLAQTVHATPVGSLSCATSTQQITFNISYFSFGLSQALNIGSQSSGAGAGQATPQPLEVHAALSTFVQLAAAAADGASMQQCTLTTMLADGDRAEFLFKLVDISSITAFAERTGNWRTPAQYTDVQLKYMSVKVKRAGGSDDGGTTIAPYIAPGQNNN